MFTVRGAELNIGDCLFVPTGGDELRFGNLEDAREAKLWLSFAAERAARRAGAEPFDEVEVLRHDEIDATPPADRPAVGARYLLMTARDRARVVCVEALDEGNGIARVTPVLLGAEGEGSGQAEDVDAADLYPPVLFATISRWRYERPSHPLVDVFQDPVGVTEALEGPATLHLGEIAVPVNARATFRAYRAAFELDAHYQLAGMVTSVDPAHLSDERLVPEPPESMPWRADVVVSGGGMTTRGVQYLGSIAVTARSVVFTEREAPVVITREIYSGAPWGAWSHPILYREPPVNQLQLLMGLGETPSSVQFLWRGVAMTLYRPYFADPVDGAEDHLAVVRVGQPLPTEDMSVLGAFIGYCTGGRARNGATEIYDMNGKLAVHLHDRGQPTARRSPPMPLDRPSPYAVPYVIRHLPTILDAMATWRARDARSFDAVFHHYAEGVDSAYPITRTLRLAVAFEAFVNLVTQDFAENEPIMDDHFETVRDVLYAELEGQKKPNGPLSDVQYERLKTKITNLNVASNSRRQRAFWEAVPIAHSKADDGLLRRLRNDSVHRGYVGEDQTREGLLAASADADRLTDLFNRAVLTYAGYAGPVRSSADGSWLEPISAERFRVPPMPPNPTLHIQHTVSMPPMTPEEQGAHDVLLLHQRTPEDPHYIVDPLLEWN